MKAKKQVVILVACGSGIATSTLAADAIKDICDEIGIDAVIKKSNMSEILTKAQDVDVVFTTNKYSETLPVPSLSVTSLITGIERKGENYGTLGIDYKTSTRYWCNCCSSDNYYYFRIVF